MGKILQVIVAGSLLLFLLGTALAKDPSPPKKTPELLSQGKKLYEQNCVTCHGSKGDGKGQLWGCTQTSADKLYPTVKRMAHHKRRDE